MTHDSANSGGKMDTTAAFTPNRRDVLKTATGLAAAAVVGGAIVAQPQIVTAVEGSTLSVNIVDLGAFPIQSFSWGATNLGSFSHGGGGGTGKVQIQDVDFVKYIDQYTAALLNAVATGKHFPSATLTYADRKGTAILQFRFEDLTVSSFQVGAAAGGDLPTEQVTLTIARFAIEVPAAG